jgi:hypothetical protein
MGRVVTRFIVHLTHKLLKLLLYDVSLLLNRLDQPLVQPDLLLQLANFHLRLILPLIILDNQAAVSRVLHPDLARVIYEGVVDLALLAKLGLQLPVEIPHAGKLPLQTIFLSDHHRDLEPHLLSLRLASIELAVLLIDSRLLLLLHFHHVHNAGGRVVQLGLVL